MKALPIEESFYRAKAVAWDLGETKNGDPKVGIEFVVVEGDYKDSRINWFGFFTEKTEDRTLEALRYCGWTGTDISDLTGLDANVVELKCEPEDMKDDDGEVVVDEKTGEVKQRLRVRWVNRGGGLSMKTKLGDDKKKLLAARMKARIAALDAKAKRNGTSAAAPGNGGEGPPPGHPANAPNDDLPF